MRSRIILSIMVALMFLSGCRWSNNVVRLPRDIRFNSERIKILELKEVFNNNDLVEQYRARAKRLESKHNITIEYIGDGTRATLENQINSILSGKSGCDILAVDSYYTHRFIGSGIFIPISRYNNNLKLENKNLWNTAAMQAALKYEENFYGVVPYESASDRIKGIPFLLYNKSIVEDKPFSLQKLNKWSYKEFSDLALNVSRDIDSDGNTDIWGVLPNNDSFLLGLSAANGTGLIEYKNGKYDYTFTNANSTRICDLLLGLTSKGLRMPEPREIFGTEQNIFKNNLAGMIPTSLDNLDLITYNPKDLGIAMFPTIDGRNYKARDDHFPVCGVVNNIKTAQAAFIMAEIYKSEKMPNNRKDTEEIVRKFGLDSKYRATIERALKNIVYTPDAPYLPLSIALSELFTGVFTTDDYLSELEQKTEYRMKGIWQSERILD